MIAQPDNQILSSFLLFLENKIQNQQGFINTTGQFFPIKSDNQFIAYSSPFKSIVSDSSISGIINFTGITIGNSTVNLGQSPLTGINYGQGVLYFNSTPTGTVSGAYSINEFPVRITTDPEEVILFETKFQPRPKANYNLQTSGLAINTYTYPIIYIRNDGGNYDEFEMGGTKKNNLSVKALILADNDYNLTAIMSVFKSLKDAYIPLINSSENPFNVIGSYKNNVVYNYNSLTANKLQNGQSAFIESSKVFSLTNHATVLSELAQINPEIYPAIAEIEISSII